MNWRRLLPGYHIAELETERQMLRERLTEREAEIAALKDEVRQWQDYALLKCQSPPLDAVRRRAQAQTESPRHFNPRSARREAFENAMKADITPDVAAMGERAEKYKN
jgi:hypothetical protein